MKKFAPIFLAMFFLLSMASSTVAGVNVGINIGIPFPAFVFSAGPSLVVIPGTYVYMVPDVDFDIFFYEGWWYRPWEGRWYRAPGYNGPWGYIESVPRILITLPPGYAYWRGGGGPRFSYGEVRDHWRAWERERYWDHDPGWRSGWEHRTEWGHPGWRHEGGWRAGREHGHGRR